MILKIILVFLALEILATLVGLALLPFADVFWLLRMGVRLALLPFRMLGTGLRLGRTMTYPLARWRMLPLAQKNMTRATFGGFLLALAYRRIGVEIGQVVPLASAPATGGIERHFALTGRGNGGEDLRTAASRARCQSQLGIAEPHAGSSGSCGCCSLDRSFPASLAAAAVPSPPRPSVIFRLRGAPQGPDRAFEV